MAVFENRASDPFTGEPFVIMAMLFDFVIGSAFLRRDHQDWLRDVAAPFLNGNPNATFILHGFASRSGASSFNQQLSQKRLDAVLNFLTAPPLSVPRQKNVFNEAVGERAGEIAGQADGTEDKLLRAVAVELWFIDVRRATQQFRSLKRKELGVF
jgi:outer membrane protein OmpA-like peptidoglycan-associated protein